MEAVALSKSGKVAGTWVTAVVTATTGGRGDRHRLVTD